MKRGDVVVVAGGSGYTGKPRPAVILQSDVFHDLASVVVAPITSVDSGTPLLRVPVEPDGLNGLRQPSFVMVDKITSVRRDKIGQRVGIVAPAVLARVGQALQYFLALDEAAAS